MEIRVVLVEPEYEGNVGSIARLMKNFELYDLWLVKPKTEIGKEALAFASHAKDVLRKAKIVNTLHEALMNVDYTIGTTSILSKRPSSITRIALAPQELAQLIPKVRGKVAILFGRESRGLSNEELARCDILVTILSSSNYRTLNVASASAIIFYEMWNSKTSNRKGYIKEADKETRERLVELFCQICQQINLPIHREKLVKKAFKNIICRSLISKREATLIRGILRKLLSRHQEIKQ